MSSAAFTDRVLLQILACLPDEQMKRLKSFCHSDFHGGTPLLGQVLEELDRGLKGKDKVHLSAEWLCDRLQIAATTLEKTLSHLLSVVRDFAGEMGQQAVQDGQGGYSLAYFQSQGLGSHLLEMEWRKHKKRLSGKPESTQLLLEELQLADAMAVIETATERKMPKQLFDEHAIALERIYVVSRLKYHCAQLNVWRVLGGIKPELDQAGLTVRLVSDLNQPLGILGTAYSQAYSILGAEQPMGSEIGAFAEFLKENESRIEKGELVDLYGYLLNCTLRGVNQGIAGFAMLLQQIYMEMHAQKMLMTGKFLDGGHFKNLMSILLRNQEWELAKQILEAGSRDLEPVASRALIPHSRGLLEFHQGRYDLAASWFRKVLNEHPKDAFWGIEARVMLWKALFEGEQLGQKGGMDEIQYHYDAFRVFIARNKTLSDYHKRCYSNFARMFHRLAYLLSEIDPEKLDTGLQKLLTEAETNTEIANRKWLISAISRRGR